MGGRLPQGACFRLWSRRRPVAQGCGTMTGRRWSGSRNKLLPESQHRLRGGARQSNCTCRTTIWTRRAVTPAGSARFAPKSGGDRGSSTTKCPCSMCGTSIPQECVGPNESAPLPSACISSDAALTWHGLAEESLIGTRQMSCWNRTRARCGHHREAELRQHSAKARLTVLSGVIERIANAFPWFAPVAVIGSCSPSRRKPSSTALATTHQRGVNTSICGTVKTNSCQDPFIR